NAHVFVLPCIVDSQGDQDGIPVALMEAMALGVPVISTPVSGIPELIESESSGLLVQPKDSAGLAEAIARIDRDDPLRAHLAKGGRTKIESEFELSDNAARLHQLITRSADGYP
ncbi:MAG: glycosyltransferase, partial [Candidatus Hydrogenedentota bacterium]